MEQKQRRKKEKKKQKNQGLKKLHSWRPSTYNDKKISSRLIMDFPDFLHPNPLFNVMDNINLDWITNNIE